MPQTQKVSRNIGKIKLISMLGAAFGWGKPQPNIYNQASTFGGIYSSKSNNLNLKDKHDFMQNLLEIRLNDLAVKYCTKHEVSSIHVKVIRITVTAYDDGENNYIPLINNLAIEKNSLPRSQFYFANETVSGRVDIFIYSADNTKLKDKAPVFQEQLNKEINNTDKIERALKKELWHYVLLERTKQNGLKHSDLTNFNAIEIIHIHDAYLKSCLREELLEQRCNYLESKDINAIDDKFETYKKALRDKLILPRKDSIDKEELAIIADCVQDLYNATADDERISTRVRLLSSCRQANIAQNLLNDKTKNKDIFDLFIKVCSEHLINGKKINLTLYQTKDNHISQIAIEKLRMADNSMFNNRDEDAISLYFQYDKKDLQTTIDEIKNSIRNYFKDRN